MSLVAAMKDRCRIGTQAPPSSGEPVPSGYALEDPVIRCRVSRVKTKESVDGSQAAVTDWVIRVPVGTTVTSKNRINVTRRERATVDEYYAIVGDPDDTERHRKTIILNCRRLVGNSAT